MFEFHRNSILIEASKEQECFVRLKMLSLRTRYETAKIPGNSSTMRKLISSAMTEADRMEQIYSRLVSYESTLMEIVSVYTQAEYRIVSYGWKLKPAGQYVIARAAIGSLGQIRNRIQDMGCIRF